VTPPDARRPARLAAVPRAARAVLGVCLSLAVALAGCTSARDTLGTNASICFEALPVAGDAVHHHGTFTGVRLVSLTSVGADTHLRAHLAARAGKAVHDVCVVSYRGTFRVDGVERPLGRPPAGGVGHYAIVIVSNPQDHLLGTVVRLTQPLRFGHPV
jgi:hypothetical protein